MHIEKYFHQIEKIISDFPAITSREVSFEQRTRYIGLIKGILTFYNNSEVRFKEFVDVKNKIVKYKYAYHFQKNEKLIFRYDNHPYPLKNVPKHHKHYLKEENILKCDVPDLKAVLKEVLSFLP